MAQHLDRINNCAWLCPARAGARAGALSTPVCATLDDPHKLLPWPSLFWPFEVPTCLHHVPARRLAGLCLPTSLPAPSYIHYRFASCLWRSCLQTSALLPLRLPIHYSFVSCLWPSCLQASALFSFPYPFHSPHACATRACSTPGQPLSSYKPCTPHVLLCSPPRAKQSCLSDA